MLIHVFNIIFLNAVCLQISTTDKKTYGLEPVSNSFDFIVHKYI